MQKLTEFTENPSELKMLQKEKLGNLLKFYRNVLNKMARLSKANHYKDILEYNKNKQTNFG